MSALVDVQTAIYSLLSGDATLTGMAGVYDHVDPNASMPYINIGEFTEAPMPTHDKEGWDVTATIHVYSEYRGMREVGLILNRMDVLLNMVRLTIAGWDVSKCERVFAETMNEAIDDTMLRHLVSRWRIRVLESS